MGGPPVDLGIGINRCQMKAAKSNLGKAARATTLTANDYPAEISWSSSTKTSLPPFPRLPDRTKGGSRNRLPKANWGRQSTDQSDATRTGSTKSAHRCFFPSLTWRPDFPDLSHCADCCAYVPQQRTRQQLPPRITRQPMCRSRPTATPPRATRSTLLSTSRRLPEQSWWSWITRASA